MSIASEGAIVEGANSITLNKTTLVDNNNKLNDQSETYKNIFLYRPVSGDASEGIASFSADESLIETNKGDTIFVTNTKAKINLSNNKIVNNDNEGAFLRIQKGKWGKEGKNGGIVSLETDNQELSGDIYVDDISELTMDLKNKSEYFGTINGQNSARKIDLSLDETSMLTLTGDSYLSSLTDDFKQYNNINLNGHTLYVGGKAITSTGYIENISGETIKMFSEEVNDIKYTFLILITIIIIGILSIVYLKDKRNIGKLGEYDF